MKAIQAKNLSGWILSNHSWFKIYRLISMFKIQFQYLTKRYNQVWYITIEDNSNLEPDWFMNSLQRKNL